MPYPPCPFDSIYYNATFRSSTKFHNEINDFSGVFKICLFKFVMVLLQKITPPSQLVLTNHYAIN